MSPSTRLASLRVVCAALALALLLAPSPSLAQAKKGSPARKFGRGLAAMTTCFLEVPGNIVQETDKRGAAWGVTLGFAEGLGRIVPRVLVGVYEFLTAPFPAPADYKPIIQPEYPWDYFD
jgi:putative exosortase-associated protein (TIGR04073 family)